MKHEYALRLFYFLVNTQQDYMNC